jgi:hypothetical protein
MNFDLAATLMMPPLAMDHGAAAAIALDVMIILNR